MTEHYHAGPVGDRRKRLLFRAHAERHLAGLDEAGLDQFEALLTAPDQDVYAWLRGAQTVPPEFDTPVFAALQDICRQQNPRWGT